MTEEHKNVDNNYIENDPWGDDELTAIDLSAPFVLDKSDWTAFYNAKGYDGKYPFLLYAHEDADVLNDRIMAEVNRTQVLTGHNKLQLDLFTRFADINGEEVGFLWVACSGLRTFATDLQEDFIWLVRSGVEAYLKSAYAKGEAIPQIHWHNSTEESGIYDHFEAKQPPVANTSQADVMLYAHLTR